MSLHDQESGVISGYSTPVLGYMCVVTPTRSYAYRNQTSSGYVARSFWNASGRYDERCALEMRDVQLRPLSWEQSNSAATFVGNHS